MSNSNLFAQKLREISLTFEQEEKVISLILQLLKNEDDNLRQEFYKLLDDSEV